MLLAGFTLVDAVKYPSGHTTGPRLYVVAVVSMFVEWFCSHQLVTSGGWQRSPGWTKIPYPGSHAASVCGTNCQNEDAQPDVDGQAVVMGSHDVVTLPLISGGRVARGAAIFEREIDPS